MYISEPSLTFLRQSEILGISREATPAEVKKAYHRAALSSHPDKKPEAEREQAEIHFKSISKAYEILSDDSKRGLYDQYGMSAFESGGGGGGGGGGNWFEPGINMDDLFEQMNMGGAFGSGRKRQQDSKGADEVSNYEVSLEEMYKGKTTKFTITKRVICENCDGSGGRDRAKARKCGTCDGKGAKMELRPVGPGLVTQEFVTCSTCSGRGSYYVDRDKCKKCKGQRTVQRKKILELHVPRGSREGDKIVFEQEADQVPDQEPGNVVFVLTQKHHDKFARNGNNLMSEVEITLLEALTGLNRVVLTHLDGRGVALNTTRSDGRAEVIRPPALLRIKGQGMPKKRSDECGDLFLAITIKFPDDDWMRDPANLEKLRAALPEPRASPPKDAEVVDEVDFVNAEIDEFADESDADASGGAYGGDDREDMRGQPGCQQQ